MASPAGSANGGIIGLSNKTSFGKDTLTSTTCTGSNTLTTQPGTRLINTVVVAGGGGSGTGHPSSGVGGGGGGAGGLVFISCVPVCGATGYPIVIGGGGTAGLSAARSAAAPGHGGRGQGRTQRRRCGH